MRRPTMLAKRLGHAQDLRLVLHCSDAHEAALCEHIAFAFARDAGLRGVEVCHLATVAGTLAVHVLARGGGELELRYVDDPRPAVELRARDCGPLLRDLPTGLQALRDQMSELFVDAAMGTVVVVTARKWLCGNS